VRTRVRFRGQPKPIRQAIAIGLRRRLGQRLSTVAGGRQGTDANALLAHFLASRSAPAASRAAADAGVGAASLGGPRARLVAVLTETIGAAVASGDLHAARVAHEALGKLLTAEAPGAAYVTDAAADCSKRGGK